MYCSVYIYLKEMGNRGIRWSVWWYIGNNRKNKRIMRSGKEKDEEKVTKMRIEMKNLEEGIEANSKGKEGLH